MKTKLIFFLSLHAFTGCFQKTIAQQQAATARLKKSLMKDVPVWMSQNNVPCVGVGLIDSGKIKLLKVFGYLQKNKPAPVNTLFNIASQTKPVVAMLVLQLIQKGKWQMDEPLANYWIDPDIAGSPYLKKLTTRIVLSHQTGFPNWRSDNGLSKLQFNFEPGTKFGYSGEGFEYLRRALENKFHKPLDKLLNETLFQPLHMKDTRYWGKTLDSSRFAQWHNAAGVRYPNSIQTPVNAADDLITSIKDYCNFGIFVMNGAGLSDALYNDMVSPQVKIKEHYYRGLGWGLVKDLPDSVYALEHGGSDIGVRTMAIFLPSLKKGIVVMTNGDNGTFVSDKIIKEYLADGGDVLRIMNKSVVIHERIALADSILQQYEGAYQQGNGKMMNVIKEGNALKISGDGLPTALVFPESVNRFFLEGYDVQIEFGLPKTATAGTLTVYENGKQVMKINKAGIAN